MDGCRLPNFLIIGAAKSGTTSLWQYLRQHPEIFMHPKKQLNFFSFMGEPHFSGPAPRDMARFFTGTLAEYAAEFRPAAHQLAVGEASNSYLYSPAAAERIHRDLPNVRLIAILRHPAERAYSRYLQLVETGREQITEFSLALDEECDRIRKHWWPEFHYLHGGLYCAQIKIFLDIFGWTRLKVYLYEDLEQDAESVLCDIFEFLEVDPKFKVDVAIRYGTSGLPKNKMLHSALKQMRRVRPLAERLLKESYIRQIASPISKIHWYNLIKPPLTQSVRTRLIEAYAEDTLKLQDLLKRDLSGWLK
jgi:hypothetical protein